MGQKMIEVMDKICKEHNPSGWVDYKSRIEWNLIDAILEDLVDDPMPKGQILLEGDSGFTRSRNPLEGKDLEANRNTILYANLEYAQSMKLVSVNLVAPETDLEQLTGLLEEASRLDSGRKREFLIQSLQGSVQNREHCVQNIVSRELDHDTPAQLIRGLFNPELQEKLLQSAEKHLTLERSSRIIEDARQEYKLKLLGKKSARANNRTTAVQYTLTRKGSAYVRYDGLRRRVMRITSFLNPTWVILGAVAGAKPFAESLLEGGSWLYSLAQRVFELLQSSGTQG